MAQSRGLTLLLAGCSVFAVCTPAFAQGQDVAEVETIIVTAQNRAENVQDVPIAIDVIGSDAIRSAGVTDFREVDRIAPAVNITQDSNYTRVTVRGVGTNSNDEAQDQSIAINVDGEYLNRPNILNTSLFDLDRVEVLRGPQGTLYGRNATGGAINFITRKPGDAFAANGSATYGNYDLVTLEGGVDLPLGGVGGLRIAGIYNKRDGYFFHPNLSARSGSADNVGGRVSLRLTPTEALTVDLAAEYVEIDNIISAFASVNLNAAGNGPGATCSQNGFVEVAAATPGVQCIPQNTRFLRTIDRARYPAAISGVSTNEQQSTAVRGRVQYDLGSAILTYTGGYRHTSQDADQALPPAYEFLEFGNKTDTQSHELRLNGDSTGRFQWQVGAFFYQEELDNLRGLFNRFIGPNGSFINFFSRDTKAESIALFGQVEVPITESLTAVAGARYTNDDRKGVFGNYGFRFNTGRVPATTPPPQLLNLSADGEKVTWLASLNYKPNDDTLVYAKISTGYKAGGFDSVGAYDPETNTAYEAGAKLNFGSSGQHRLNLAGYYYDYKDLQVSVLLNSAIGGQIFNAGAATIKGLEAEFEFKLSEHDTLTGSFNYLDAQYDQLLASYAVFCVGCADTGVGDLDNNPATVTQPSLAGNRLPQSPKFILALGYEHVFDFGEQGSLTAGVYSRLKSPYFLDIFNYADSRQSSYTQTDLSLEYKPASERWRVQAFLRNLENERPLTFASFTAAGPDDVYIWSFGAPRTYGVRASFEF